KEPQQNWDAGLPEAVQESNQRVQLVERLGHRELRASLDLLLEALHLLIEVLSGGIHRAPDEERGRLPDRVPAEVGPGVELLQDPDQSDRIDVEDRGGVRVVARAGRIAGQREDVPDAER